jgi:MoxR-like ATPase
VLLGASPRALRDWLRAAQASAYLEGRSYVIPDDLLGTAEAVLSHRLVLRGNAGFGGRNAAALVKQTTLSIPFPKEAAPAVSKGRWK